jgi:hypothetical protein
MLKSLCLINYARNHEDVWGNGAITQQFLTSTLDGVKCIEALLLFLSYYTTHALEHAVA